MAKQAKQKKEKHTVRTVLIVIVVVLIIIVIGSMGGDDSDEKESEIEIESELTLEEALQAYMDHGYNLNRSDLTAHLEMTYPEDEVTEAVENSGIDWQALALQNINDYLSGPIEYSETDLRDILDSNGFTEDEIDYAVENADWSLQTEVGTDAEDKEKAWEQPIEHITEYKYNGVEDNPDRSGNTNMFWSVFFDEDADEEWYTDTQFKEIIISCMQQPESKENEADGYGITGYDSDGNVMFTWTSYDDKYTVTQFVWRSGQTNPDRYEWKFSSDDYNDIISAKSENDSETEFDNNEGEELTVENGSDSSQEWEAGSLAYLNMSRDELLQIYNEYDQLLLSEDTSAYTSEEVEAFETGCAEQIADEYDISVEDADNIYIYGSASNYFATFDTEDVTLKYADSVEVHTAGDTVIIKAKITPSATNQQTIDKNYYNVCDFIRDYSGTDFNSISYWATADTTDGDETKVISFDLPGDIINTIATQDFADNTLGDYVENLYILPSLQD